MGLRITRRAMLALAGASAVSLLPRHAGAAALRAASGGTARILVGFAPGGLLDVVARLLTKELNRSSPAFIVENRPGAGGRSALGALKTTPADGATMVLTPASMIVLYPHLYKKLAYDVFQDLAPVTPVCSFPFLVTVGPMIPAEVKTLTDFVQWCRRHPGQATYGTAAAGSMLHFTGVALARAAAFDFVHAPYGGPGGIQDLAAGRIAATIYPLGTALPHVLSGRIRALATSGPQRSPALPEVPTVREAGFPALESLEWFGIVVPAKTPAPVLDDLNATIREALRAEALKSGLAKLAVDVSSSSSREFAELIRADFERWGPIVRASGFTPED